MRGPGLMIALAALGGGLYYMSNQAEESAARRAALQQAGPAPQPADGPKVTVDMYDVSPDEGGIRGAIAQAALDAFENPQVPAAPEEIAAATKAMQTNVRQVVMSRTGLDIEAGSANVPWPALQESEIRKTETETTTEADVADAVSADPSGTRQGNDAVPAVAGALGDALKQAMNAGGMDGEIEKLINQLEDPDKGRRIVAKAKAKGAPDFAIMLGLKRQIDKEREQAAETAANAGERRLPKAAGQFKSATKSSRFKSVVD